jgi:hypothetical protein
MASSARGRGIPAFTRTEVPWCYDPVRCDGAGEILAGPRAPSPAREHVDDAMLQRETTGLHP